MKDQASSSLFRLEFSQSAIRHLIVLVLLAAITVVIAFQLRLPMKIAIGGDTQQYTSGFYFIQNEPEHSYRWTNGNGVVRFPDVGKATPLQLSVVANAWRDESQVYTATVTVNGNPVGVINKAGWRNWRFLISDPTILRADELVVGFHSTPFVPNELSPDSQDFRKLGVAVDSVEVQPQWPSPVTPERWMDLITFPSLYQLGFVVLFAPMLYLFSRYLGLNEKRAFYLGLAAIVLLGVGTAFFRFAAVQRVLIFTLVVGVFVAAKVLRDLNRPTPAGDSLALAGRPALRRIAVLAIPVCVMVVAFLLRVHSLTIFPGEGDEGIYMAVAEHYAQALASGNWQEIIAYDGATGQPALYELVFALGFAIRDAAGIPWSDMLTMRLVATAFGVLQVGLLAVLNPVAGWFLAVQTTEIKFTSMAYLEALPALAVTIAVVSFERFRRTLGNAWLYLSAIALGAAGASKFIYLAGGLAILVFLVWEQRRQPRTILVYGFVAGLAFFVFDPYLWADPVGRLHGMFSFHMANSTRDYVQELARPWWYTIAALLESAKLYLQPWEYPPPFLLEWDAAIFVLGVLGLPALLRRSRLYVMWLLFGAVFISLWEAKWEQYAMVIATPLCLSAGYGVADALAWLNKRLPWKHSD